MFIILCNNSRTIFIISNFIEESANWSGHIAFIKIKNVQYIKYWLLCINVYTSCTVAVVELLIWIIFLFDYIQLEGNLGEFRDIWFFQNNWYFFLTSKRILYNIVGTSFFKGIQRVFQRGIFPVINF